jgi:hypothetical protein
MANAQEEKNVRSVVGRRADRSSWGCETKERGEIMRNTIAITHVTLDGVMQSPGASR